MEDKEKMCLILFSLKRYPVVMKMPSSDCCQAEEYTQEIFSHHFTKQP